MAESNEVQFSNELKDIIKRDGIYAKGYGVIPKYIMLDPDLPLEAKVLYAYFSCHVSQGTNLAFPGRALCMKQLGMGKQWYYKCINFLKDQGYISVQQEKVAGSKFSRNIISIENSPQKFRNTASIPAHEKAYGIIRADGLMAAGYGFIARTALIDERLKIKSKGIYAYFCAYSGSGESAYPERDKMLFHLQISEATYYRFFPSLKKYNYITVIQRHVNGKLSVNDYKINDHPDVSKANSGHSITSVQYPQRQDTERQDTEVQYPQRQDTERQDTEVQYPQRQDTERQDTEVQSTQIRVPVIQYPQIQDTERQDTEVQYPQRQDTERQDTEVQYPQRQDTGFQDSEIQDTEAQYTEKQDTNINNAPIINSQKHQSIYQQTHGDGLIEGVSYFDDDYDLVERVGEIIVQKQKIPLEFQNDERAMRAAIYFVADFYGVVPEDESKRHFSEKAYALACNALAELACMRGPRQLAKRVVTAAKVIDHINTCLNVVRDGVVGLSITEFVEAAVDDYTQGVKNTHVRDHTTYMQACLYNAFYTYSIKTDAELLSDGII